MPYNNSYNQQIAKQHMAQQYRAADNRNALNGGSLEAVGLDGSGLLGSAMAMRVAPIVAKIANKLVASGYSGGNMAFVEKMLNEKFEKHGLPKSMIPTITKLINCFNTKGELNDIINALPLINAIVKPLIGGMSGLSGGVSTADYKMGEGRAMGCGKCGCDNCECECSDCEGGGIWGDIGNWFVKDAGTGVKGIGENIGKVFSPGGNMDGGGISSMAQVASSKWSYYDGKYQPLQLDDPVGPGKEYRSGAGHDNLIVQGGYRTKGAKDVKKRCPDGEHIARSTNTCQPHRNMKEIKLALNRNAGDGWRELHTVPKARATRAKVPKAERPKRSNPGAQVRAGIVKQVMAEQGLSMIEASKFVKANNLYQPQARSPPTRARIDLGATHRNLQPSATKMRKPRELTQLESNLSMIDPREFKTQPKAVANPSSIFKAPKRAKKSKVEDVNIPFVEPGSQRTIKQKDRALTHAENTKLSALEAMLNYDLPDERRAQIESQISRLRERPNPHRGSGGGMDQKEELMAERNGQFVGLAVGRPGVRPKKATGGRALVPIDQLPSAIGGSINRRDYTTMI